MLKDNKMDREMTEGVLPASAPLANPYVPFQRENPPRYEARKGIIRGTMYPGLDLPFMGMVNQRELPDTPLTHRDDKEALEVYRAYQKIYHKGMMEYGANHTPLTHGMPSESKEYDWLNDPWPWEYYRN